MSSDKAAQWAPGSLLIKHLGRRIYFLTETQRSLLHMHEFKFSLSRFQSEDRNARVRTPSTLKAKTLGKSFSGEASRKGKPAALSLKNIKGNSGKGAEENFFYLCNSRLHNCSNKILDFVSEILIK